MCRWSEAADSFSQALDVWKSLPDDDGRKELIATAINNKGLALR